METFNPVKFGNEVNSKFIDYQLTTFPLADEDLGTQARNLLKTGINQNPLIKGPYVSISKSFKWGRDLNELVKNGDAHPALPGLADYPQMFLHQDKAYKAISAGKHCLISTGTGSGKTEAFFYPIFDYCLKLRDEKVKDGIAAILIYPMNALAIDQLYRLRRMLAGSGISFGLYIGSTAESDNATENIIRLNPGEGREEYEKILKQNTDTSKQVSPLEERITEKEIAEKPPRILLTNVKQLELLMTREKDIKIFLDAPLKYLVFDEAHTYSGIAGAEVSCLIRRLRTLTGKTADDVICIGTSATIVDPELGQEGGKYFANRFFGIEKEKIELIEEEYLEEEFPVDRYNPLPEEFEPNNFLDDTLKAIEKENIDFKEIERIYKTLSGKELKFSENIFESLYDELKNNDYIFTIYHLLKKPDDIKESVNKILLALKRNNAIPDEKSISELICYLALGAVAQKKGNPLIRPKIHYFVKGLEGMVVAFEKIKNDNKTLLYLSKAAALEKVSCDEKAILPLYVCKTCGQHFFESKHKNIVYNSTEIEGGDAEGDNCIWLPEDNGKRCILTNKIITVEEEESNKYKEIFFCTYCGALHKNENSDRKCSNPKCKRTDTIIKLLIVETDSDGNLKSCPGCNSRGKSFGRKIEPIKIMRATTVADVHILAQNMVNAAVPDNQKLIVFADNRQDAAFQSGWMQDHARRYRFRHLIYEYLKEMNQPVSIGDIQNYLYKKIENDKSLGLLLAPEVYEFHSSDYYSLTFKNELKKYLRNQILREIASPYSTKDCLESWGTIKFIYKDIDFNNEWINNASNKFKLTVNDITDGILTLLDAYRRGRILYDADTMAFTKYWSEGDTEVQSGYVHPFRGVNNKIIPPKALLERKSPGDIDSKISYFRSSPGTSFAERFAGKWGLSGNNRNDFLTELWEYMTEELKILKSVDIISSRGTIIKGGANVYQLDSSKIGILKQWEYFECNKCKRIHSRKTPKNNCSTHNCDGKLVMKEPSLDNYNIGMLKKEFSMLKPAEHTAQVPAEVREQIEVEFKKETGKYNCLVASPTLELGVDIGALDMILMRNVPPRPSNYWQRAGRAGRRQRLAVIYTYCRRSKHDLYFFEDPLAMLEGTIETPRFNLRNEVMVRKHVHAVIISEFLKYSLTENPDILTEEEISQINIIIHKVLPVFIKRYLFDDDNHYLAKPYYAGDLNTIITKHKDLLVNTLKIVFNQYWPDEDKFIISDENLMKYTLETANELQDVVNLLHLRMNWALDKREKLVKKQNLGLLEPEDKNILARCNDYLEKLSHTKKENYTLLVLSEEGFLPGYGLYNSGIKAFAKKSLQVSQRGKTDFEISRNRTIALREFIPGNLIYANGGRFNVTLYHISPTDSEKIDMFFINLEKNTFKSSAELNSDTGYNTGTEYNLSGIPVSDCDLRYISRINDEEQYRFQMPMEIIGKLKKSRSGGVSYNIQKKKIQLVFGQKIILLNAGPSDLVKKFDFGYPVCKICGAVRSSYVSDAERKHFEKYHSERCGQIPEKIVFTAEDKVDGILLSGLKGKFEANNLGEGIIIGASLILEMERTDLSLLAFPSDDDSYNAFIYDPMPGGSGLLNQIVDNWEKITENGISILDNCPNKCETSCYECMNTYYNVFNHDLLSRKEASKLLLEYLHKPVKEYDLPPEEEISVPVDTSSTNPGEASLGEMLNQAGFSGFVPQKEIKIGMPYKRTTPDFYFEDSVRNIRIAVYLDGLSKEIHGNAERRRVDIIIRNQLKNMGIHVIEIATSDLCDPEIMKIHFQEIANILN